MAKGVPVTKEVLVETLMEFHEKVQEPVMNDVLGRLGNLETKMGNLETRMDGFESEMSGLKKAVWNVSDHQGKKLDEHEKRLTALEEA